MERRSTYTRKPAAIACEPIEKPVPPDAEIWPWRVKRNPAGSSRIACRTSATDVILEQEQSDEQEEGAKRTEQEIRAQSWEIQDGRDRAVQTRRNAVVRDKSRSQSTCKTTNLVASLPTRIPSSCESDLGARSLPRSFGDDVRDLRQRG